ncbi:MAG: hypothetical protein JNM57_13335 [Cyclobacteriaceae bacterium]|nr:hypothetical protein [Cyclobacteriaceae bacterium]
MKKIPPHIDDQLLDYLDGALSEQEKEKIEFMIRNDQALANRLEELRSIDRSMQQLTLEHPSKNFTQVVMHKLDQYPLRSGLTTRNGIILLAGVLVTTIIATLLISAGVFDGKSTTIDLNQIELTGKYISRPLPSIPFNGKMILNVIIMLNLALGFLVLDRAILKPYFQRRMQAGH